MQSYLWLWFVSLWGDSLPPSWFSLGNGRLRPLRQATRWLRSHHTELSWLGDQGLHTALGLEGCQFKGPEYAGLGSSASSQPRPSGRWGGKQQAPARGPALVTLYAVSWGGGAREGWLASWGRYRGQQTVARAHSAPNLQACQDRTRPKGHPLHTFFTHALGRIFRTVL